MTICPRCGSRRVHAECTPADLRRWDAYVRRVEAYHASPQYQRDMAGARGERQLRML